MSKSKPAEGAAVAAQQNKDPLFYLEGNKQPPNPNP
jgi:hypothetical protein